jgi:hypothetical protein
MIKQAAPLTQLFTESQLKEASKLQLKALARELRDICVGGIISEVPFDAPGK